MILGFAALFGEMVARAFSTGPMGTASMIVAGRRLHSVQARPPVNALSAVRWLRCARRSITCPQYSRSLQTMSSVGGAGRLGMARTFSTWVGDMGGGGQHFIQ